MRFSIIILSIIILISCQKDISNQFIQPPKYKGENVSEVFPYVKYTSVKTLEYNKPDTFGIFDRKIPVNNIGLFMDSLEHKFLWEDMDYENLKHLTFKDYRKISDSLFIFQQNPFYPTDFKKEKPTPNAQFFKMNRREIKELSSFFRTSKIPSPKTKCLTSFRDAIIFYDNDKIVSTILICFSCHQISIYPKPKQHIRTDRKFWEELSTFLEQKGHDVTYGKRLEMSDSDL